MEDKEIKFIVYRVSKLSKAFVDGKPIGAILQTDNKKSFLSKDQIFEIFTWLEGLWKEIE